MPVLEDGLSSGHASDSENNCTTVTVTTTTTTVANTNNNNFNNLIENETVHKFLENGANTDNSNFAVSNDELQEDVNEEILREIQKLRDLEHNPYQQVYSAGELMVFIS